MAIGGITLERAAEVYGAGADSLAVIRDLICAPDPGNQARKYLDVAASAAASPGMIACKSARNRFCSARLPGGHCPITTMLA